MRLFLILAIAGTVVLLGVTVYVHSEFAFRMAGMVLQLAGVALVIYGVSRTLKRLGIGLEDILRQLGIPIRRKPLTICADIHEKGDIVSSQATVGPAVHHTLEEQVALLEKKVDLVRAEANKAAREEHNARIAAIEAEQRTRMEGDQRILQGLDEELRSNLPLEAVGAVWIFIGIFLATASQELARVF